MHAYRCLTGSLLFMLMFIYMYVSMLVSNRVIMDHSCGRMISYVGEWHEEVPDLMRNQLGRVVRKHI